jgi:membrane-bound lytic murein transglycosylase D
MSSRSARFVLPLLLLLLLLLFLATVPAPALGGEAITKLLSLPIPRNLTFCGEAVPLHREDVLERLDLELIDTVGSPVRTALWLKRAPRYFPAIEAAIRAKGLPEDLKYVALVESNLRDDAVSEAGAVGPWQFMRQTAAECGIERTEWRDGARDWSDSTSAALGYLSQLHRGFSSWNLALAAYNGGMGRVTRALESQGATDFYDLRLARETERYVFRAIAAKLVLENPAAYGIRLEGARIYAPEDGADVELRVTRSTVPLSVLAKSAGLSYRGLRRLNPWMTGADLPAGIHRVLVPAERRTSFAAAVARWEGENPERKTIRYQVKQGDTLSGLAARHGVSVAEICAWNGLSASAPLPIGKVILLNPLQ